MLPDYLRVPTEHKRRVFDVQPSEPQAAVKHPVGTFLPQPVTPFRRVWRRSQILDQGSEGACVGHGVTEELAASPVRVNFEHVRLLPVEAPRTQQGFAFWLYQQAKLVDEYPGEDYDGTSINAAMQIARRYGLIESWRWAHTRYDFVQSLMNLGPVVIAIPWLSGMYEAPDGILTPSGEEVGWHCLIVNGYDPALSWRGEPRAEMVRIQNSWGPEWGYGGLVWMNLDVLWSNLLSVRGAEMCVVAGRHLGSGLSGL